MFCNLAAIIIIINPHTAQYFVAIRHDIIFKSDMYLNEKLIGGNGFGSLYVVLVQPGASIC